MLSIQQQHPPPYHIAKAFTKKSKQDLLIYDIYRNNYQHQQHQHQHPQQQQQQQQHVNNSIESHLQNDHQDNSLSTQEASETNSTVSNSLTVVDSDNNEINTNDTINHSRNNSLIKTNKTPWLFGEHKNPTVVRNNSQNC